MKKGVYVSTLLVSVTAEKRFTVNTVQYKDLILSRAFSEKVITNEFAANRENNICSNSTFCPLF
jgi:hypothetical protein